MTGIAIIVPVLNRPGNVAPLMRSVAEATPEPHRLLFVAQDGDTAELAALEQAGADFIVVARARQSWACKINDGVRATTEAWIFTGADDLAFRPGWFPRALEWATDTTGVIGTNDLWNPRVMTREHSTHSLIRRSYITERGTVDQRGIAIHEGYGHDFADDELVATAKARGVFVHATDSIVEHLRPRNIADEDETYRLGRKASLPGKRLFLQRRRLWLHLDPADTDASLSATVVTACYGGVDTELRAPATQDMPVEWVCFTDDPTVRPPEPWKVRLVPAHFADPGMAAKVHKATPDVAEVGTDVVWVDGSMQITSPSFVREALAARRDGVAVFKHPRRDCVYDEAEASLGAEGQNGKYATQPLMKQVAAYRAEGHPEHGGLYACGVVAWDLADPKARDLGAAWLAECEQWSWQDQLSFPVVCRRMGVTPGVFPLPQIQMSTRKFLANRWLRIWPHSARPAPLIIPPPPAPAVSESVSVLIPYTTGCPHREAAHQHVLDWYAQHHPTWEIVEGRCKGAWSKGAALAVAAGRASHDLFVVADADTLIPPDVLEEAVRLVAEGAPWVMPHRVVYRLSEAHTARIYAGAAPEQKDTCRRPYAGVQGGGVTVLTRAAWNLVGGVDPRFVGWGGEDLSYGWALTTLCGPAVQLTAPLFHLWHPQEHTGGRRRGSPESEALAGRYRDALGKPEMMATLVAEHMTPPLAVPA